MAEQHSSSARVEMQHTSAVPPSSRLLALPLEIRREIYFYALLPPPLPDDVFNLPCADHRIRVH